MYELSRARLHAVGPDSARYQDVILDFSGAGEEVAHQQNTLFGPDEPLLRPSPATVLFLENGGGKSVLIKLIFSVLLPGRRQVVGTTNTRVLENFVRASDVAHVVLEWMHAETGRRLVTGKVSEWRGHVASSDGENLVDLWYHFRPSESVGLDTLCFTAENQLLSMSAFRDQLNSARVAEPALELYWTQTHYDWTNHLDALGLDTELYRYQREMNAGEGEAAGAFGFSSDEAFVEFFLRAVLSESEPKELAEVVGTYSGNLARRDDHILERDFVAGALELLEPLAQKHPRAIAAHTRAAQAHEAFTSFARQVMARNRREAGRLKMRKEHVEDLGEAEKKAEGADRHRTVVLSELQRSVADLRLRAAVAEQERVTGARDEAKLTESAWHATETVLERINTENTARQLRNIVYDKEEKARPVLAARNRAASALARGLLALARDADSSAEQGQALAQAQTVEAEEAQNEQTRAMVSAATASSTIKQVTQHIEEVRDQIETAIAEGLLTRGTAVPEAAAAAREAVETVARALADSES